MQPSRTTWYVYRLYSTKGELLYIGYTHSTKNRYAQHASKQPWWDEVCIELAQVETYINEDSARCAETFAIKTEHPKYNKTHNRAFRLPPVIKSELAAPKDKQRRPKTSVYRSHAHQEHINSDCSVRKYIRDLGGWVGRGKSLEEAAKLLISKYPNDRELICDAFNAVLLKQTKIAEPKAERQITYSPDPVKLDRQLWDLSEGLRLGSWTQCRISANIADYELLVSIYGPLFRGDIPLIASSSVPPGLLVAGGGRVEVDAA